MLVFRRSHVQTMQSKVVTCSVDVRFSICFYSIVASIYSTNVYRLKSKTTHIMRALNRRGHAFYERSSNTKHKKHPKNTHIHTHRAILRKARWLAAKNNVIVFSFLT